MASDKVLTGQIPLSGMERPQFDLGDQQTFAHIAQPEFWGIIPYNLSEDNRHMMDLVSSGNLEPSLIGVGPDASCSVGYRDGYNQFIRVALTPAEYGLISRNAEKVGEASVNKTLASRPPRSAFELDAEAAERSGVHTLKNYVVNMERYIKNTLEPDRNRLARIQEYVSHPQLRRQRGDNLRINMGWVREHIFGDTFVALRRQRNWTPDQEALARKSLDARLFLDRDNNRHLRNWADMLAFEDTYWGHKWAVFKSKTAEAKHYIKKHE